MCSCSLVTLLIHSEKHWRLIRCHCIVQGFTNMVMKINRIQSLTGWFVLCCKQALGEQCGGCPHEKLWPCPSAWKPKTIQPYHQELPQKQWAPFTEKGASQSRAMSGVSSVTWWTCRVWRLCWLPILKSSTLVFFLLAHATRRKCFYNVHTNKWVYCKFELNTNARI